MIRILTQTQYDAICDLFTEAQEKIKFLEEQIKAKNEEIDEQAQEIYSLQEDLACFKWHLGSLQNMNKILDHAIAASDIDFPNSSVKSTELDALKDNIF